MKKLGFMTAVSLAALLAAAPAIAGTQFQSGDDQTLEASPPPASDAAAAGVSTMPPVEANARIETIEAAMLNPSSGAATPISIDKRMTAGGMLGKPIYNQKNERVATVEDLILDANGQASMIVVKDNSFLGLGGKLAAFDYTAVIDRKQDGDIVMPITDRAIEQVAEFSYQPSDRTAVRVIPSQGYSLKKILEGNVVGPDGKKLAAIDNVTLKDGRANLVIAAYNQIFNMGGDRVALDFDTAQLVREDGKDDVNLKLTSAQAQQFVGLKEKKD